jgi:hypothetical protein
MSGIRIYYHSVRADEDSSCLRPRANVISPHGKVLN